MSIISSKSTLVNYEIYLWHIKHDCTNKANKLLKRLDKSSKCLLVYNKLGDESHQHDSFSIKTSIKTINIAHTNTPFNGPFSVTTRVSRYQKGKKPIWILLEQETVSGSGISWAICKSAPRSRQITTPVPHHSIFYRPDALPAAQPTASKHWRQRLTNRWTISKMCQYRRN